MVSSKLFKNVCSFARTLQRQIKKSVFYEILHVARWSNVERLISLAIIVLLPITCKSEKKTLRTNEFFYLLRLPDENPRSLRVRVPSYRCPRVPPALYFPPFAQHTGLYTHTGNELYRYVLYVIFFPPWLWNSRPTEYINILVFVILTESDYYRLEPVST